MQFKTKIALFSIDVGNIKYWLLYIYYSIERSEIMP